MEYGKIAKPSPKVGDLVEFINNTNCVAEIGTKAVILSISSEEEHKEYINIKWVDELEQSPRFGQVDGKYNPNDFKLIERYKKIR